MSRLNFHLQSTDSSTKARASEFTTLHGKVETPIFMPVGTQATVRTLNPEVLKEVGSIVLLANTYHLLLRPGAEVFRQMGGIHRFMNWDRSILTDSGGFQIFSLPNSRKMTEEGASFRSYVDGQTVLLSPESSIEMQVAIGSDIMMVLDECVPSTVEHSRAKSAMEVTHRWAKRSLKARGDSPQSMFGIIQGACYSDLRKESAKVLTDMPFDGFAIGGLAVGETKEERNDFCELSASLLPENLPRYLMGVGTPLDLLEAVKRGVDMFDCTIPVELAQRGVAFTSLGKLQIHRSQYKFSMETLDPNCQCNCCSQYSRAYLHHLIKANEVLGWRLIAIHNLVYYHKLMKEMRDSILKNSFESYYKTKIEEVLQSDNVNPSFTVKQKIVPKKRILGDYEVVLSRNGEFFSIRQKSSGEVMHSVNSPMVESKTLYIDQSCFSARLQAPTPKEIVIWDVGLGAGTNAMSAVLEWEKQSIPTENNPIRNLKILSFENDLDPFRLAVKNHGLFPQMFHPAPKIFLKKGEWTSENETIHWKLFEGNFESQFEGKEIPDLVYYDPFSFKTNTGLWSYDFFERLYLYWIGNPNLNPNPEAPKSLSESPSKFVTLITYSASTMVRSALLYAGFWVGKGKGIGPKSETTLAWNQDPRKFPHFLPEGAELLDASWLERWNRSDAKYPQTDGEDIPTPEWKAYWEKRIQNHGQFVTI